MSISEQVKELRENAKNFSEWEYNRFYDTISRAADTIESLSAKLEKANKELERWHTDKVNDKIKNPFAWTSTLCCHNCDHKDEYIEELEASDMERSADCGGGWTICNKYNLPKEKGKYWVTYFWSNKGCVELCDFEDGKFYPSSVNHENVYAWKPCDFPKPYCEDEPKYEYES